MYKSDERHDLKERPLIAGSRCYYTPTLVSRVCVEARVTLKSLMLFGRRYVAHCLPLAPAPAELELDPPLSTSTSQAFDTFCCKYLEPPLLGSFISISRLCASSTSASVAVGFTLRIMRAWVARKGNKQLALMRCCTALATTSGGGGTRTSLSSKPPRPDRKPALAAFAAADAPPLSGAFKYTGGGSSYASARVHMAWVPEARLPRRLLRACLYASRKARPSTPPPMTMTLAIKRAKGAPTIRRRGSDVKEVVNASINQNTPNLFQFLFLNLECKRIED